MTRQRNRTTRLRPNLTTVILASSLVLASIPSTAHAREFRYDAANRLRETRDADRVTTYNYDGWGQLTRLCFESDTEPLRCRDVVVDELPEHFRVVGLRDTTGSILVAHDPTGPVAHLKQNEVDLLLRDRLGSVRAATSDGELQVRRVYDAYGEQRQDDPSPLGHGYAGELTDTTGMVHLRARHLLPTAGRLVQRDTIAPFPETPQTLNRYTYVAGGNPLAATDPSGHFLVAVLGVAVGTALLWADALSLGVNAPESADDPSRYQVRQHNSVAGQAKRLAVEAAAELVGVGTAQGLGRVARRFLPGRRLRARAPVSAGPWGLPDGRVSELMLETTRVRGGGVDLDSLLVYGLSPRVLRQKVTSSGLELARAPSFAEMFEISNLRVVRGDAPREVAVTMRRVRGKTRLWLHLGDANSVAFDADELLIHHLHPSNSGDLFTAQLPSDADLDIYQQQLSNAFSSVFPNRSPRLYRPGIVTQSADGTIEYTRYSLR